MAEFGLQVEPAFGFEYRDVLSLAENLGDHGFSSLWASDHFMLDRGHADLNCMEAWTMLASLAAHVESIRVGTLVTCASYRNPALLAKIVATLDHISGGRVDFGIGAGWKDIEYSAYGYRFPSAGQRAAQLEEALEIITSLWTKPVSTFSGEQFSVNAAVSAPKPVQRPHPPILIGGSRTRLLRTMARYADMVNFVPQPGPEEYREMSERFNGFVEEAGRDPKEIRRTHLVSVVIGRDDGDVADRLGRVAGRDGITPDEWRQKRSRAVVGTTGEVTDLLRLYTDAGVSQFMVVFPYREEMESLKLFADGIVGRV